MRRPLPAGSEVTVRVPVELHPTTKALVKGFATALAEKLRKAEIDYGYGDGWRTDAWEAECRQQMLVHIDKGDPRDVAIYCAFMWQRGWRTSERCDYCGPGVSTGLPGNACENCMNTGVKNPVSR